ncbi:hypothetical protein Hanom_Chr08g00727621 [Helianthus anomalus]
MYFKKLREALRVYVQQVMCLSSFTTFVGFIIIFCLLAVTGRINPWSFKFENYVVNF